MNTLKWFGRWVVWLFIVIREIDEDEASERGILTNAIPAVFGVIAASLSLTFLVLKIIANEHGDLFVLLFAVFLVAYLLIGLGLFFAERITNDSHVPWYRNGQW